MNKIELHSPKYIHNYVKNKSIIKVYKENTKRFVVECGSYMLGKLYTSHIHSVLYMNPEEYKDFEHFLLTHNYIDLNYKLV